jgi:hypothetical protein
MFKDEMMKNTKKTTEEIDCLNSGLRIEKIDESSDSEIKKPFDPVKVDVTLKTISIDILIKRMKSNPPRIDLNTEFQRRGNLWDETSQSRLIESLLVRIPIPAFYFDGSDDNNWKVVDGLQRLTTLKRFIIDKELKLQNLEFLDKYKNKGFDDLPAFLQGRIEETQVNVYIINPGTPDDVKYNIFKRINTGGIVLEPQEIRHALNQGIPADFVKELAELPEFNKATHDLLVDHQRMEDRDFVTRFIAFYNGYDHYQSDLDDYLNSEMRRLNQLSGQEREKIKKDFIKAMTSAYTLFGEYAFRKMFEVNGRKHPLNKALFDTWSVNLAKLSDKEIETLIARKDDLIARFIDLMLKDDFRSSITTGTGKINAVKTRFSQIEKLIRECIK